jgi:hypothetical protein
MPVARGPTDDNFRVRLRRGRVPLSARSHPCAAPPGLRRIGWFGSHHFRGGLRFLRGLQVQPTPGSIPGGTEGDVGARASIGRGMGRRGVGRKVIEARRRGVLRCVAARPGERDEGNCGPPLRLRMTRPGGARRKRRRRKADPSIPPGMATLRRAVRYHLRACEGTARVWDFVLASGDMGGV